MPPSCLSLVSLIDRLLHRSLAASGLTSQAVEVDGGDTTIHFWGPPSSSSSSTASTRPGARRFPPAKPALIFIHGFGPQGIWQWRQQIPVFAKKYSVYIPDLVFFGGSHTFSGERTESFQANCVAQLLEKLGISRYSLVGTSYGGFVAYRMATMWPDRVDKVVIASSGLNMRRSDYVELLKRANVEDIEGLMLPANPKQLRTLFRLCVYRPPYMPDFVANDVINKLFAKNRKEKLELLNKLSIGQSETVSISPLTQEVLIVWGEHDQVFLLEKAKDLQKLLGEKAKLEVITNASHTPQVERSAQFNSIVDRFLQGAS